MNEHTEALLRACVDIQGLTHQMLAAHRDSSRPASVETIVLTTLRPLRVSDVGEGLEALSIGLLNPNAFPVYLGIGGNSATASGGSPSAPANSLLVLPVDVRDIQVGADTSDATTAAQLAAGDAVVFLLRFPTVQPAFLGSAP